MTIYFALNQEFFLKVLWKKTLRIYLCLLFIISFPAPLQLFYAAPASFIPCIFDGTMWKTKIRNQQQQKTSFKRSWPTSLVSVFGVENKWKRKNPSISVSPAASNRMIGNLFSWRTSAACPRAWPASSQISFLSRNIGIVPVKYFVFGSFL